MSAQRLRGICRASAQVWGTAFRQACRNGEPPACRGWPHSAAAQHARSQRGPWVAWSPGHPAPAAAPLARQGAAQPCARTAEPRTPGPPPMHPPACPPPPRQLPPSASALHHTTAICLPFMLLPGHSQACCRLLFLTLLKKVTSKLQSRSLPFWVTRNSIRMQGVCLPYHSRLCFCGCLSASSLAAQA